VAVWIGAETKLWTKLMATEQSRPLATTAWKGKGGEP